MHKCHPNLPTLQPLFILHAHTHTIQAYSPSFRTQEVIGRQRWKAGVAAVVSTNEKAASPQINNCLLDVAATYVNILLREAKMFPELTLATKISLRCPPPFFIFISLLVFLFFFKCQHTPTCLFVCNAYTTFYSMNTDGKATNNILNRL